MIFASGIEYNFHQSLISCDSVGIHEAHGARRYFGGVANSDCDNKKMSKVWNPSYEIYLITLKAVVWFCETTKL